MAAGAKAGPAIRGGAADEWTHVSPDHRRQWLTVAAFAVTVIVNALANILPINGQQTGAISDRFEVFVIPAGYVFSMWGVIYLLLAAFTIDQARPSRADDATLRRLGYLPLLTGVLNTAWLLLFQYEVFVLTVPVMIGLLVTLIRINAITFADRRRLRDLGRWTIRLPFSRVVYCMRDLDGATRLLNGVTTVNISGSSAVPPPGSVVSTLISLLPSKKISSPGTKALNSDRLMRVVESSVVDELSPKGSVQRTLLLNLVK